MGFFDGVFFGVMYSSCLCVECHVTRLWLEASAAQRVSAGMEEVDENAYLENANLIKMYGGFLPCLQDILSKSPNPCIPCIHTGWL
jgi:hypothetical protein